jgi:hypothetical protein
MLHHDFIDFLGASQIVAFAQVRARRGFGASEATLLKWFFYHFFYKSSQSYALES